MCFRSAAEVKRGQVSYKIAYFFLKMSEALAALSLLWAPHALL